MPQRNCYRISFFQVYQKCKGKKSEAKQRRDCITQSKQAQQLPGRSSQGLCPSPVASRRESGEKSKPGH